MKNFTLFFLLLLLFSCNNDDEENGPDDTFNSPDDLSREVVVENLNMPWGMTFLDASHALLTQKSGEIILVNVENGSSEQLFTVPNAVIQGQGGLLGIALSPNFESDNLFFVTYTKQQGGQFTTALGKMTYQNSSVSNFEEIYVASAWSSSGAHFGSRITFDNAGYLYFSIGDRGAMNEAQNTENEIGCVLRLNADGSVPTDNPFVNNEEVSDAIFTYGNRNIQGLVTHPETGEIWSHEHGPQGGDEINLLKAGENYGWPLVTHGEQYGGGEISSDTTLPGMKDPLHHWTPSIAPSGMCIIDGDIYSGWKGHVLTGALAGQHLNRVIFNGTNYVTEKRYFQGQGRIRDVVMCPTGHIYFINESEGAIFKVNPEFD